MVHYPREWDHMQIEYQDQIHFQLMQFLQIVYCHACRGVTMWSSLRQGSIRICMSGLLWALVGLQSNFIARMVRSFCSIFSYFLGPFTFAHYHKQTEWEKSIWTLLVSICRCRRGWQVLYLFWLGSMQDLRTVVINEYMLCVEYCGNKGNHKDCPKLSSSFADALIWNFNFRSKRNFDW